MFELRREFTGLGQSKRNRSTGWRRGMGARQRGESSSCPLKVEWGLKQIFLRADVALTPSGREFISLGVGMNPDPWPR